MKEEFDASTSAFLNALLREWSGYRVLAGAQNPGLPISSGAQLIEIPLRSRGGALYVCARRLSRAGRHRLLSPVYLSGPEGATRDISFAELVAIIMSEEDIVGRVEREQSHRFMERVLASARNIASNIEARAEDIERIFSEPLDFIEAEQALLTGHSIHPTPKARNEFSDADARRYAPEFKDGFPLRWYAVRRDRWLARWVGRTPADAIVAELVAADSALSPDFLRAVPDGYALLPAHPWQAARSMESDSSRRALDRGDIIELGEVGAPWTATSSLRTVYAPHAPWMLKFSTSVRLTNSLRTLCIPELERGLVLCQVLASPRGGEYLRRFPSFRILAEPLYLGLMGEDGAPIEESIVAFRENPFQGALAAETYVLATLLQDHPLRGTSRLARHVVALAEAEGRPLTEAALGWFRAFLGVVLEPVLVAQADYGILLSAHQQNIVVRLEGGYPSFVWFRDCQGTAYSALAQELFGREVEGLSAHTFQGERADFFFSYSVIINAVFNVVSSLAIDGVGDEDELLTALRSFLIELRRRPLRDRRCLDYLLESPELWSKGNFFCCLRGINEATIDDPLRIYHRVENPLRPRPSP